MSHPSLNLFKINIFSFIEFFPQVRTLFYGGGELTVNNDINPSKKAICRNSNLSNNFNHSWCNSGVECREGVKGK